MRHAPTFGFALAACAAFGAAIVTSARPDLIAAPLPEATDAVAAAAAAAERAEAEAAFERAAAARSTDHHEAYRGLRSLLGRHTMPAAWLADRDASDRLGALHQLGIEVVIAGQQTIRHVAIRPRAGSRVACDYLEHAAASAWGAGKRHPLGHAWETPESDYRAVFSAGPVCELRIEYVVPIEQLAELVPFAALGEPGSALQTHLAARDLGSTAAARVAPDAAIVWQDAGLAPGGFGPTRVTAQLSNGRVAALEATAEALPAIEARLSQLLGPSSQRAGARHWDRRDTPVVLTYAGGHVALTAGTPPASERAWR